MTQLLSHTAARGTSSYAAWHDEGFALLDAELRFREVNDALAALHGLPAAAHLGRSVAEVLPALAPTLEPLLRRVLATGEALLDLELPRTAGATSSPRGWRACYYPVRSRGGSVVAIDVVVRGVAAPPCPHRDLRTLAALREREQFAASIADASPNLIYVYNLITNTNQYTNRQIERLFGYRQEELEAKGPGFILGLIHPEDQAGVFQQVKRLRSAADGEVLSHEYRFRHHDGSWRWLRSHELVFQRDAAGTPTHILGVAEEVTAYKAVQEALRVSEERFRVALQGSPVVVFNQDQELRYTWIYNPALGFTAEALIGLTDHEMFERREDAEHLTALKRAVLADGVGRRHEVRVWSQGHVFTFDLTIEPLRDHAGQVVGVTAAAVDITAHKQREQAVRDANEQTWAALARAEGATRERDLLISVAAHDLRTPLTVILGQAQLLQRRAERAGMDARSQQTLATITAQAERLNTMIATLLDLSRIQEGQLTIQPAPVDLRPVLEQVISATQATTTSHELVLDAPPQLLITADVLRLEQVFLNLLGNAVKYSPHGGLIRVWAEHTEEHVGVQISDEGIGIPDEALPHLFTRFYRAPNAKQQAASSLGVGLFIVRALVHAHGGTIAVRSTLGQGSTFTIRLPMRQTPPATTK